MHSFNLLSEGHLLTLQAILHVRNTVFSEDQQDQDNAHRHRVVMSLQGMWNAQTCEGSIRSAERHITARCLGSLLYPSCAGHHFALHATAHTSKATRDERLSYPLVPASLRPTPRWFVAAIHNQVHSQDALRELPAKKGVSPKFYLCFMETNLYCTVFNRHVFHRKVQLFIVFLVYALLFTTEKLISQAIKHTLNSMHPRLVATALNSLV